MPLFVVCRGWIPSGQPSDGRPFTAHTLRQYYHQSHPGEKALWVILGARLAMHFNNEDPAT